MLVQMAAYHVPVLLEESITGLNVRTDGVYVDLTFGGGGHSAAILKQLGTGKLIAFDRDEDVVAQQIEHPLFTLLVQNYRYLKNNLDYLGISEVDGIIADLGVSSHQFDDGIRGFTFRQDTPLDMRMNRQGNLTAADIINDYSDQQLETLLRDYAEIKHPEKFVERLIDARKKDRVTTTGALADLVRVHFPGKYQHKMMARIFQALRIEVNHELDALREALKQGSEILKPGGRFVVISYHSLEDRMVKHFFRYGRFDLLQDSPLGETAQLFQPVNKKVITPTQGELRKNPRARSARLRIAEKIQSQ